MNVVIAAALIGLGPGAAIGLGRFAYALVLPDMLAALDLGLSRAGLLGSANTAGYFVGALISHRVLARTRYARGFYLAALLQCLTLFAMAAAPQFPLMAGLRFAQGALGAFVFVGGAALVLASGGRAVSLALYFGSIGVGIVVSTAALPLASDWRAAWVWLGALALGLSLLSLLARRALSEPEPPPRSGGRIPALVWTMFASYGLYGAGYIAYMTFVTAELTVATSWFWVLLGVGAVLNGPVWGPVTARLRGKAAQVAVLLALTISSLPPLVATAPYLSALLFGVSFLGVVTAITELVRESMPPGTWPRAMAVATAAFALGQAAGPALAGTLGDLLGRLLGASLGPAAPSGADLALYTGSALLFAALVVGCAGTFRGRNQEAR